MINGTLNNITKGMTTPLKIRMCRGFFDRLRGLLGTRSIGPDEACWLIPCNSIHTLGMQYPIDVYFLNKKNEIVSVIENMPPNRFSSLVWKAHSTLEFSAGKRNLSVGDQLRWEENSAIRHCEEHSDEAISASKTEIASLPPVARNDGRKHTRGQTTVEFAFTLLVFLVMFLCISDLLRISYSWLTLQYASNRGIRIVKMLPRAATNDYKAGEIRDEVIRTAGAVGVTLTNGDITVTFDSSPEMVNVVTVKTITLTSFVGLLLSFGPNHGGNYTLRVAEVVRNAPIDF